MTKRASLPSSRHHVFLYDEDWDFLAANYGPDSASRVGVSEVIRAIVHKKVLGLKAEAAARYDAIAAQRHQAAASGEKK